MKGLCLYSTDTAFAQHLLYRSKCEGEQVVYTSTPLKRTATTTADVPIEQSPIAIQEASKKGLTARKQLAAIDWNYHLETKTASNAYGETSVSPKYNQRTKTWNVRVLKESKDYQYIWMLMAKVFRLRCDGEGGIQRAIAMDTDDPRQ